MFFSMLAWETEIRGKSLCKNEEKKGKNLSGLLVQSQTLGANVGVNQSWICPDGNCSFLYDHLNCLSNENISV